MTLHRYDNNGIGIAAHVEGSADARRTVVLLHGFPQSSHCWRHQVRPLVDAGYRVVRPDLRGFGDSDAPQDVASYLMDQVTTDVPAVLDGLGIDQAVVVGHDWGASLAWSTAALHPERVSAVVGVSVPFTRRSKTPPIERLVEKAAGNYFYMDYFQEPGVAEAELQSDPMTIMRALLHTASGEGTPGAGGKRGETKFADSLTDPGTLPDWLGQDDLEIYVEAFERSGWTAPLNWYRAMDPSWRANPTIGTHPLEMPSAFLAGAKDMVLLFTPRTHMRELLPDLREELILPGIGHWVQEEAPGETSAFLLRFLDTLDA